MSEFTIKLHEEKRKLTDAIRAAVVAFQEETGISVKRIGVTRHYSCGRLEATLVVINTEFEIESE